MGLAQVGGKITTKVDLSNTCVDAVAALTDGKILVFDIVFTNPDGTNPAFLQLFDSAASGVTLGTTAPTVVFGANLKSSATMAMTCPMQFTALSWAATGAPTTNGAPGSACQATVVWMAG